MAFHLRRRSVRVSAPVEPSGGWYPDPFGVAARRWYDHVSGWSDRVEEAGRVPDKTGVARADAAVCATGAALRPVGADGQPLPLSRPVDRQYMADARPVR